MELNGKINFSNVAELTRMLGQRKISKKRFKLDISEKECANGIYAALKVEVANRNRKLQFNESTKGHILQIARWLVDGDGKPGLMLRGDVGNGKTSLLLSVINLVGFATEATYGYSNRKEIVFKTAKEISRMMTTEEGRKEYSRLVKTPMLAIDELGEEPGQVMVYGMIHEPLKDLLLERYSRQLFTMVTSNLKGTQIEEKYSTRIRDRFREMMEVVNFKEASFR